MSFGKTVTLSSGHAIPQVGFGTWQSAPGEVGNAVYEALKAGYRHLDLAKIYHNQKEVAGGIKRAYADVPGLKREDIFITSKLWNNAHRPENVEKQLDETLAELELDYLDLYLIHWPVAFPPQWPNTREPGDDSKLQIDRSVSLVQTWKAVTELPKSKVRSVGVSNFTIEHLQAVIDAVGVVPAVHQFERHPRLPQRELVDFCAKHNIHVTAYSQFGNNNVGIPLIIAAPEVKAIADRLSAARNGETVTPAQVVLAWGKVGGHSIIPKSVTASRIQANFQEVELDEEVVRDLNALGEAPHRFNIPRNYSPTWDINIFDDKEEKGATYNVQIKL